MALSLYVFFFSFIKRFSDPTFHDPETGISLDKAANVLGMSKTLYEGFFPAPLYHFQSAEIMFASVANSLERREVVV